MKPEDEPPALACHLNAGDHQQRIQRFAQLNREFLLESRRLELGLESVYSVDANGELRDLVRLEEECCPFLRFRLEPVPGAIKLSITAPESARDSIDVLIEPFRAI